MVLGRGSALFRVVRLGGNKVRKARGDVSDVHDAADVLLYRDSSLPLLLDMRRRFKAVMVVLGAIVQYGVSLFRSVELTAQWDRILAAGPLYPVTIDDLSAVRGLGIGDFFVELYLIFIIVSVISFMQMWSTVGMKQLGSGGIGFGRILWFIHKSGFDLIWFLQLHFSNVRPHLTLDGSGVLADPARIDEEFRKAWLLYFCRSGQRDTSLEEFDREVDGWLPLLPEVDLPRLTGQVLADVVQRMGAIAGSPDDWVEGVEGLACFLVR